MIHNNAISVKTVLELIENGKIGIRDIERITEDTADAITKDSVSIKGHTVYFVDFKGYFGYSCLVFMNGRHIHYANDYQLHHRTIEPKELREYYIGKLNGMLFTDDEIIFEPVKSYEEKIAKEHYIRN